MGWVHWRGTDRSDLLPECGGVVKSFDEVFEEYMAFLRNQTVEDRSKARHMANLAMGFPEDYPYDTDREGAD